MTSDKREKIRTDLLEREDESECCAFRRRAFWREKRRFMGMDLIEVKSHSYEEEEEEEEEEDVEVEVGEDEDEEDVVTGLTTDQREETLKRSR